MEFQEKLLQNQREAEERTAKKRAKRLKKKAKRKEKIRQKKLKKNENAAVSGNCDSGTTSDDSDSSASEDQKPVTNSWHL